MSTQNPDEVAEANREMRRLKREKPVPEETEDDEETYDCVLHGTGPGPDCPRC